MSPMCPEYACYLCLRKDISTSKISSLRERISLGRLSPVLSATCAGWAALDDFRNWGVRVTRATYSVPFGHRGPLVTIVNVTWRGYLPRIVGGVGHKARDRHVSAIDFHVYSIRRQGVARA